MKAKSLKESLIAIVDDERSVTSLLSTLLEYEGYKAICFNSGSEFLKYLETGRVDIVFQNSGKRARAKEHQCKCYLPRAR